VQDDASKRLARKETFREEKRFAAKKFRVTFIGVGYKVNIKRIIQRFGGRIPLFQEVGGSRTARPHSYIGQVD